MKRLNGFTLLELLLAMTLLGIMLVLLFSGLHMASSSWRALYQRLEASEQEYLVSRFLRRELQDLRPVTMRERGRQRTAFRGTARTVTFVVEFPSFRAGGGLFQVSVGVEDGPAGEASLVYRYRRYLGGDMEWPENDTARSRSKLLTGALTGGSFAYLASRPGEAPDWRDEWTDQRSAPQLVRLRFGSPQGETRELYIPIQAGRI